MKKIFKTISSAFVALLLMFTLTSCSFGKYVCTTEIFGVKSTTTYELKLFGSYEVKTVTESGNSKTESDGSKGKYKVEDKTITFTPDEGDEYTGTLEDGKLVIGIITFTK